jgi:hypothetical protein
MDDLPISTKPEPDGISPDTKLYVTPDRKIAFGEQAEQLLRVRNDSRCCQTWES